MGKFFSGLPRTHPSWYQKRESRSQKEHDPQKCETADSEPISTSNSKGCRISNRKVDHVNGQNGDVDAAPATVKDAVGDDIKQHRAEVERLLRSQPEDQLQALRPP